MRAIYVFYRDDNFSITIIISLSLTKSNVKEACFDKDAFAPPAWERKAPRNALPAGRRSTPSPSSGPHQISAYLRYRVNIPNLGT